MINRKNFLKNCAAAACAAGMCRGVSIAETQASDAGPQPCDSKDLTDAKNRAEAAQYRFSKLIETMENKLPAQERKEIFNTLGGRCADTYRSSLIDRYKGNIRGFLEEGRRNWMAEATYDEAKGFIRIVDKGPGCSCPMTKEGVTPGSFCDCTLGWQERAYSEILGKLVKAELEESILRGGKKCIYRIQVI